MSPTVRPAPRAHQPLTGRHVLVALLTFFGVIFAVNGYFLYAALSTHTGVVSVEPYRKGLAYNERIAADERQSKLGWTADIVALRDGVVTLSLQDASGRPLSGQRVTGTVGRPSTNAFDRGLDLREINPGQYQSTLQPLLPGGWIAQIEIRSTGTADTLFRIRRRLWLTP